MARINERQREKYWKDPDAAAARIKKWRDEHPDLQKAIEARNREKHKPSQRERNKQWRLDNPEYIQAISKKLYEETRLKKPWKNCLRGCLQRALDKRLPFELSAEWAEARWTGHCELTGIPFSLSRNVVSFYSPSIDRIVPERGYVPDNCRFILNAINGFKSNGTDADMLLVAKALVEKLSN